MNQLSVRTTADEFDVMQRIAKAMVSSGYFSDAKDLAKAVVKIMAGRELGLGEFASMTGIHVIQGKPAIGANVIATLIANDPRYAYRVLEHTDDICRIAFFDGGEQVGEAAFSAADAKRAGTQNMNKFPRNMLFARALSNGAKWYTPGIFGGSPVYTPEELGAEVDEDGEIVEVIDVTPAPNGQEPPPPATEPELTPAKNENNVADIIAEFSEAKTISLLEVRNILTDLGIAKSTPHAWNIVKLHPNVAKLSDVSHDTKVSGVGAAGIVSWAAARKDGADTD